MHLVSGSADVVLVPLLRLIFAGGRLMDATSWRINGLWIMRNAWKWILPPFILCFLLLLSDTRAIGW